MNRPLGIYVEGPGCSRGCRGQFARELGRPASRCGELGALPEHPAALAAPKAPLAL